MQAPLPWLQQRPCKSRHRYRSAAIIKEPLPFIDQVNGLYPKIRLDCAFVLISQIPFNSEMTHAQTSIVSLSFFSFWIKF